MSLKKNNPGCGCCGTVTCANCSGTTPSTVSVTVSGYADKAPPQSTCNCPDIDGTYVLDYRGELLAGTCYWQYDSTWCSGNTFNVRAQLGIVGGKMTWTVEVSHVHPGPTTETDTFRWQSTGSSAIDCTATRTLTALGIDIKCVSPASVQLN